MISASCTRCLQERWPVKPGDEVPAAIAILNGEGACMGHMAPPPIDPGNPVIERLARHLCRNYVPGTTGMPWEELDPELRDVWRTEAAHFLEVAQLEILGWSVPVSVNHPTVAILPTEAVLPGGPGEFVEGEITLDEALRIVEGTVPPEATAYDPETMDLPSKWSQPRSD